MERNSPTTLPSTRLVLKHSYNSELSNTNAANPQPEKHHQSTARGETAHHDIKTNQGSINTDAQNASIRGGQTTGGSPVSVPACQTLWGDSGEDRPAVCKESGVA